MTNKKKKKKSYTTVVVEQPIAAPRTIAWQAVQAVANEAPFVQHEQLAIEPPWRWVYRVDDDRVGLHEGTITIRDDGETCHLSWSLLLDPLPDSSQDDTSTFVGDRRTELAQYCAQIATAATQ